MINNIVNYIKYESVYVKTLQRKLQELIIFLWNFNCV